MDYEYLSAEQLKGFDNYKYNSVDTSPISVYIMHPFWNRLVEYFPRWVAPNSMTFIGFLMTVANFLVVAYLDYPFLASSVLAPPNMPPPLPNWIWLVIGLSLFIAYTLDGIDGKQARRTQSSGPLGELFDHGLDSFSAALVPICLYSCFGRLDHSISPWRMYFVLWNILISFYLTHWEKYNTGILFLPWGYDFGMLSSAFVFLVTGFGGHHIWKVDLPFGYNSGTLFEVLIYLTSLVLNLPVTLYNIYKSYTNGSGKCYGVSEASRPLWSLTATIALTTVWMMASPNDLLNRDPRAVYLLCGTLFSNVSCRLIVSQMSNTRCEGLNLMMLPVAIAAMFGVMSPRAEPAILYSICFLSLLAHLHYGSCVVRQMCRHFKIHCFKIKHQPE